MFAAPRLRLLSVNCRLQPRASMSSRAGSRLKQISKHLDSKPFLELNTPFSTERSARPEDDKGNRIRPTPPKKVQVQTVKKEVAEVKKLAPEPTNKMSNQPSHPALLIPGPIEFDDAVLNSMSHYRYEDSLFEVSSILTSQRVACRSALRKHLQRSPWKPAQALPHLRSLLATHCHFRLGHTRMGPSCGKPGRARR